MTARGALSVLRKYWVLIVVLTVLGGGAGFVYSLTLPALYRSTSSVFVSSQRGDTTSELVQGSTFTQNLVQSYAQLATLPAVLTPVVDSLGLNEDARTLAKSVTVDVPLNTVFVDVTVSDTSPKQAAVIADAITASLTTQAEKLSPPTATGQPSVTMTAVAPAQVPIAPYAPSKVFNTLTGLVAGFALAVLFAFLREFLDTRFRTEEQLASVADVPVLGAISRHAANRVGNNIVMRSDPHSLPAEDFRRLRTNLEFSNVDAAARVLLVTSALPAEGKTTTTVNLALAMAEGEKRVLLIDADLRRPSVAGVTQLEGSIGLTSVLLGTVDVEDAIQPWAGGRIDVLPGGIIPPNPNQLLSSAAMEKVLTSLLPRYDYIVFDSAPLLPFTDSLSLSKITDGVIVVARAKKTRRESFVRAIASLEVVNAKLFGFVLNGVPPVETSSYYGYKPATVEAIAEQTGLNPDEVLELDEELASK
ncbi:polysaccharide biosynthesis tyrosine autokinase [Galbitalea soli]|uniref:non-specific protein-tyrosine kinase n=1 Tax=Galbitalea soli TaxID=1268042 RepID=A0A7C9PLE7_9MICO|nr:polysaccharide biosynthesis tyrosine autokinase [Galbitalea soli]NEM89971.1 polysaccharide biosynthesis tyrosine autokinase [Galbitalea soli]NYJ30677.1 capsular exopolysaccharide synthesis family protein [Galbitalea soli]